MILCVGVDYRDHENRIRKPWIACLTHGVVNTDDACAGCVSMRVVADAYFSAAAASLLMRELNGNFDADARIFCAHRKRPLAIGLCR
jgi:hypothetical protein